MEELCQNFDSYFCFGRASLMAKNSSKNKEKVREGELETLDFPIQDLADN